MSPEAKNHLFNTDPALVTLGNYKSALKYEQAFSTLRPKHCDRETNMKWSMFMKAHMKFYNKPDEFQSAVRGQRTIITRKKFERERYRSGRKKIRHPLPQKRGLARHLSNVLFQQGMEHFKITLGNDATKFEKETRKLMPFHEQFPSRSLKYYLETTNKDERFKRLVSALRADHVKQIGRKREKDALLRSMNNLDSSQLNTDTSSRLADHTTPSAERHFGFEQPSSYVSLDSLENDQGGILEMLLRGINGPTSSSKQDHHSFSGASSSQNRVPNSHPEEKDHYRMSRNPAQEEAHRGDRTTHHGVVPSSSLHQQGQSLLQHSQQYNSALDEPEFVDNAWWEKAFSNDVEPRQVI